MLRRLAFVATPFTHADASDEVIKALAAVADPVGVPVFAIGRPALAAPGSKGEIKKAAGFYSGVFASLEADWRSEFVRRGPSLIARYAASDPAPFTMVEAMRLLQPSGDDRWLCDLMRDHKVRDSLWCAYGPWLVIYLSDRTLTPPTFPSEGRAALDAAGALAVQRLKELALIAKGGVKLSPREKTILLHLSDGLTVPEIAARLDLGEPSVKTFIQRAARKLGARSRPHAVAIALRDRLI